MSELTREQIEEWRQHVHSAISAISTEGNDIYFVNIIFDMALRSLRQPEREGWVSVEERLPELVHYDGTPMKIGEQTVMPIWRTNKVLVRLASGHSRVADMIAKHDKSDPHWYAVSNVTHWMPIPAPPALSAPKEK